MNSITRISKALECEFDITDKGGPNWAMRAHQTIEDYLKNALWEHHEMLQAMEAALVCIERNVPDTVFAPRQRLRAAIAKATGDS